MSSKKILQKEAKSSPEVEKQLYPTPTSKQRYIPGKLLTWIAVLLVLLGLPSAFAYWQNQQFTKRDAETLAPLRDKLPNVKNETEVTIDEKVDATLAVLHALDAFYMTTVSDIGGTDARDDLIKMKMMTDLMNGNKYLEMGNASIENYTNSSNEYINVATTGMITGSNLLIAAHEDLIQTLRTQDSVDAEFEYKLAQYLSSQKEGYRLIAISAPWVTANLYGFAESENPTGKIPYTISDKDRKMLLDEIDDLFGEELVEYRKDVQEGADHYNTIIFAVNSIYERLVPDTYEEAKELVR